MKKIVAGPGWMLSLWLTYQNYVESVMQPPAYLLNAEPEYISNRLFTKAILFGLPVATLVLIPTVYISFSAGNVFLPWFGSFLLFAIGFFSLNMRISLASRKLIASAGLLVMGIVLIAVKGNFGIGCIYLLTCSIFYALHFSDKFAHRGVQVNALICAAFILVVALKLLPQKALYAIPIESWITYFINFLFLNVLIVMMIRQTITRFENALKGEATLLQELKTELDTKEILNNSLFESERLYREQNEKLKEIAYLQSHVIRAPLTKIMALTDLIERDLKSTGDHELLTALTKSSNELDMMIRKIVSESENVLIGLNNTTH